MTRVSDQNITIEWTELRVLGVGHHSCAGCAVETPRPAINIATEFARRSGGDHWIWPFSDWWPEGWTQVSGWHSSKYLCPNCSGAP